MKRETVAIAAAAAGIACSLLGAGAAHADGKVGCSNPCVVDEDGTVGDFVEPTTIHSIRLAKAVFLREMDPDGANPGEFGGTAQPSKETAPWFVIPQTKASNPNS